MLKTKEVYWITQSNKPVEQHIRFKQLGVGEFPDNYPVYPGDVFNVLSLHGGYFQVTQPLDPTPQTTNWPVTFPYTEIISYSIRTKYPADKYRIVSQERVYGDFTYPAFYNPSPGSVPNNQEYWRNSLGATSIDKSIAENWDDMPEPSYTGMNSSHYRVGQHFTSEAVYLSTDVYLYKFLLEYEEVVSSATSFIFAERLLRGTPLYYV